LVWNSNEQKSDHSDGGTLLDRFESADEGDGSDRAEGDGVGLRTKRYWNLGDDSVLLAVRSRNRSAVAAMVSIEGRRDTDDDPVGVAMIDGHCDTGRGKRTQQHHGRDKDVDQ
jgi:hypothetical protein